MRRYWSKRRNKQRWFTLCESAYCCPCIVNEQADYFCVLAERDEIQVILHFLLMQQSCRVPFHHCHSQTHVFEHITGYRCHRSHNVLLSGTRPIDRPSTWPGSFTVSQLHYISVNFSDHFSSHPNYSFISPLPQIEPEAERSPVSYSNWINWCESHSFFSIIFPFQWSTRESYTFSTSLHDLEAHHFWNYEIASSSSRVPGHPHGIRIGVVFFAGTVAFKHENPESSLIYQSFIQHFQRNPLQILSSSLFNSI